MKKKLFLDSHDLQVITNYSIGHCRKILRDIRSKKMKLKHQKVTVDEVADYLGLNPDEIRNAIE
ncbi:hypothetical protein [uncultured Chryseobacterium sp.]|uniref:hypothetical protein n=1 Tax=uncultured Chryseobacterium sp. TaxID=259322 RepID=UPI00260503B0|nr:hypothetical protein [uncultured Chryseobacterium sp.]